MSRPCTRRCADRQAEVGKDLGIAVGSEMAVMIVKGAAAVWAMLEVDIDDALEQPGSADARRPREKGSVAVTRCGIRCVDRRAWNELGSQLGIGRERHGNE